MWRLRILEDLFHETSVTCLWLQQNKIRGWQTAPATWLPHRPPVTPPAALVCCKLDNSNLTWNPSGKLDMCFLFVYVVHVYTSTCVCTICRDEGALIQLSLIHSLTYLLAAHFFLPSFFDSFLSLKSFEVIQWIIRSCFSVYWHCMYRHVHRVSRVPCDYWTRPHCPVVYNMHTEYQ